MHDSMDSMFHLTSAGINRLVEQCVGLTRWLLAPESNDGFIPGSVTLSGVNVPLPGNVLWDNQESTQDLGNGGAVWD